MFTTEFIKTLADVTAFGVILFELVGMAALALWCYRSGNINRQKLERRAGLFATVEIQRDKEREELKEIEKRKAELGSIL